MLFTKSDVKRAGKKCLSTLLAVLMVITSISVCFGTISFAAYDEDPIDYLAEHLKHPVVQYIADNFGYTYSGSANNSNNITLTTNITLPTWEYYVEARDLLIYLEKAIKTCKEWDYPTKYTDDMQARTCTSAGLIEAQILGSLGNVSAAAKEFISYVLEDSRATQHSSANTSQNKVPANHTATVTISTSDIKGYLNSVEGDYTTVQSGFDVSYQYVFKMTRGYYTVSKSSGISKTSYYHNYVKGSDNTNSPVVNSTNTAIKTTVNNFVTNLDAKIAAYPFETLALMTNDSLDTVLGEVHALRTNIKSEVNSDKYPGNYDKLFPNADKKIAEFEANVEKARELASYTPTANAIKAYQDAHSVYGTYCWGEGKFEEATIKADYADFMNTYRTVLEDATLYEFFTDNGVFSAGWINNFHDNVVSYDLEDTKELADALYNEYAVAHPDLGDEEPAELTLGEKQTVYGSLTGYINAYNSYTNQVKNKVFPGGIDYLLNLQEYFQCQVDASIIYFAENVNKDYTDVTTEKVIEEVATAKNQLAALNNLKNSVDFVENLSLLDVPFANADTFIAYLYSLLAERFTTQVNAANDMFNSLGRPNKNLRIEQYSKLNSLVNGIERDIVTFIDGAGKGALITQETRNILAALDAELMPAFNAFELDRGFQTFKTEDMTITREDSLDEFFRENENLDDDMLGEYKVTDENVNAIVDLLEAALKDETVAGILGDLINKDEDGNPTGEAFSLSGLITGLLDDVVFTDELLNTIVQFLYPLVLKEFAKVWAGLPETIEVTVENVAAGQNADVLCGLSLIDVEAAIEGVGLALGPQSLARMLEKNATWKTAYADVISALKEVQIKPSYNKENDNFRDPWADEVLFADVIDETTGEPVVDEETGEVKQAYKMNWGINEATDKRKAFVDAAVAALSGVEPLLLALLTNKEFTNDTTGVAPRGFKIGTAAGSAKVLIMTFAVNVEPITLVLEFSKNDGWDNVLCPIFEALGLTGIKHSEDLQSVRKFLENGLLATIDQLVAKLDANPIEFLLDALPNLAYMIDSGMIMPLLNELKTVINYYADAYYSTSGGYTATGTLEKAMKSEEPINIVIGDMLKDTLPDLSSFAAIWNMLSGVELLAGVEAPDAAYIATLGKLIEKDTNRSTKVYTGGTAGKAYYIQANRADVLEYLVTWLLSSGLLSGLVEEPSELIATIFANLESNPTDVVAAIVELLNQKKYPAKEYNWFDGTIDGESVLGNSATEIYLNPNNDWTKEKAEYLYNNIDALLSAALTMAGVEFDLGTTISGAIDGILTDKTLTALAGLLAKLDLNALLAGDEEGEDAPETVAEGEEAEAPALELDVNALVNQYLGLDLKAIADEYADIAAALEADAEYVYDFGVDAGEKTFAAVLAEMLEPLSVVLDLLLNDGKLTITIGSEKVELLGADGYNNAILPLLEALGCEIAAGDTTLEVIINTLVARIEALTTGDVIKNIIDLLPGVLYFITSNGLSTAIMNLLQPVLVIVDTIRPVFDVMDLLNNLEIGEEGDKKTLPEFIGVEKLDIKHLNVEFVLNVVNALLGLDLAGLDDVIYDVCGDLATDYTSASTLQTTWKKGAFSEDFAAADLITVVLSFVLEWATVKENAEALDEMLGTDGIIASLNTVFADADIEYGTPDWYYFFGTEEAFDAYINGAAALPNTLAALTYPNDWTDAKAEFLADNLAGLVDTVIGLIEINGTKYASVSALLNDLVYGDFGLTIGEGEEAITINYLFSDETINALIGMLKGVLANIDETLLGAGYLLDVDLVGLKNYVCDKEITTISEFVAELAYVLDTYAPTIVNLLFFGDDIRLAKKSDATDTIVINGGLGYEKGLALILEALGCDVPAADEATTANVLGALAARVEAILENPVNEVIDLLPNLVYFLNANGVGVAVDNMLQPVYTILEKLEVFGLEVDLAELLGFELKYLSLADIFALVEDMTGLDLEVAEKILVNLCIGEINKAEYTYKMTADRKDTITVVLTIALLLVSDEAFAAKLDELIGTDAVSAIKSVFESAPVEYGTPEWDYAVADNATLEIIDYAITYPNNWTEETAQYVANLLTSAEFDALVAGLIDSNYKSLSDLLNDKVNVFTTANLQAIVDLLAGLLGGIDDELLKFGKLLDVDLVGLKGYTVPAGITTVDAFADELANILNTYAKGVVEWLLLGKDIRLFVEDADGAAEGLEYADIITINGAHGYANGLALILEALGCKNLPEVYDVENLDTAATVKAVLASLAARINEIFANPVVEVLDVLPNIIYFLNANGVSVALNNLTGAFNALALKLKALGLNITLNDLVNLQEILGVETEIALDNLTMETLLALAGELTGLNLAAIEDVLVGFALGEINVYESVSSIGGTAKMEYKDEFDKHDLITVVATLAIMTVADEANADVIRGLLGDSIYDLILNLLNIAEPEIKDFAWLYTDKADSDYVFSALESSELYEGHEYGPKFTEEMAQYMADNFGVFVDNIIYLVGIEVNGVTVDNLTDLINGLLNGSVYNSQNVVAIRDALAKVLANIGNLEVNGVKVGGYIVEVLKNADVADLAAVANVEVPEFTENREAFVKALCDVLAPLYNVIKYILADKDLSFFVNGVNTDAIVLKGAEGYAYGIIPVLEALGCADEDILAPADYYAAVEADGSVLLTSILNPLLNRVDAIIGGDTAQVILDMLPNLIYFINSNGVDTVVKNTLSAVYALLSAIEPIAKLDLYEIIGLDLSTLTFEKLFEMLLDLVADKTGYEFENLDADAVAELSVGKLVSYTSKNGKQAYKMVYAEDGSGDKAEMATVVSRLAITFVMHENNQEMLLGLLRSLGMTAETEKYVGAVLAAIAKSSVETKLGMDAALSTVYYIYYGATIGADHASTGIKDLNAEWTTLLKEMQNSKDSGEALAGDIIAGILDLDIFEDIIDPEIGIAPNGFLKFFQKIAEWFKGISEFFKKIFG